MIKNQFIKSILIFFIGRLAVSIPISLNYSQGLLAPPSQSKTTRVEKDTEEYGRRLKSWSLYFEIRNLYHDQGENLTLISIGVKRMAGEKAFEEKWQEIISSVNRLREEFRTLRIQVTTVSSITEIQIESLTQELEQLLRESRGISFEKLPESEVLTEIRNHHNDFNQSIQGVVEILRNPLIRRSVNLNKIMKEAAKERIAGISIRNEIESGRMNLVLQLSSDKRIVDYFPSYPRALFYLFQNLYSNAISHAFDFLSHPHKEKPLIKITTGIENEDIVITFGDNGKGMPKEATDVIDEKTGRQRAFLEEFSQWKDKESPSRGLGLALVWDIITLHGGKIHVESQLQKGTTFTIRLPVGGIEIKDRRQEVIRERLQHHMVEIKWLDLWDPRKVDKFLQELQSELYALEIISQLIDRLEAEDRTTYNELLRLLYPLKSSIELIRGGSVVSKNLPLLTSL